VGLCGVSYPVGNCRRVGMLMSWKEKRFFYFILFYFILFFFFRLKGNGKNTRAFSLKTQQQAT
jgi:hypothetical protein